MFVCRKDENKQKCDSIQGNGCCTVDKQNLVGSNPGADKMASDACH